MGRGPDKTSTRAGDVEAIYVRWLQAPAASALVFVREHRDVNLVITERTNRRPGQPRLEYV